MKGKQNLCPKGSATYLTFTKKVTELLPETVRFSAPDSGAAPAFGTDSVLALALA
jgi:hypothetical protein